MSTDFDELHARTGEVLAGLGRDPADREALAGVVLGGVAEPGDGVLGRLAALLGPVRAAGLVLERPNSERLARTMYDLGARIDRRSAKAAIDRWVPRAEPEELIAAMRQGVRVGARLLIPRDEAWPRALDDLDVHAPFSLWVRGRPDTLTHADRSIALVGARAATGYGQLVAGEAASGLSDRGLVVVSGGAYGIDGAAHRAALRRGGDTVAFLAGGVDRFYPAGHERLLAAIAERGAVVAELPCGAAPTKWRFLQRNRLIAAATAATVVVEAGVRSGSLNTAAHAAALGRPLGAVPGPVTSPASAGCHRLLREFDAVCVTDAGQMAELVVGATEGTPPSRDDLGSDAVRVLDALGVRAPRTVEDLARRSGVEPPRVMAALGELAARGLTRCVPGGWLGHRNRGR